MSQTINPNQIRPSATNGQVLTTVAGQPEWASSGPAGNAITALHGDGNASGPGDSELTVTGTSGVPFAASATTDTTNASNIASGTIADARLSSNVPLLNGANAFNGRQTFSANFGAPGSNLTFTGTYTTGTPTTSLPAILYQATGTTPFTLWDTSGTIIGLNLPSSGGAVEAFQIAKGGIGTFSIRTTGDIQMIGTISSTSGNAYGSIQFGNSSQGVQLTRNIADALPVVNIYNQNAGSTGDFLTLTSTAGVVARIKLDGTLLGTALATTQTPAASTTASDHSIPITLNGTVYYIRLSTTP